MQEVMGVRRHKHCRVVGGRQPALDMVKDVPVRIQDIDVGCPYNAESLHQLLPLVHVDLDRNEILIDRGGDAEVRVRHGTQLGASRSPVLEEIQKDWFILLLGSLEPIFIGIHPFDRGFLELHNVPPILQIFLHQA